MEIGEVIPPDDSGRDAFSLFSYQAHAVFLACLKCATARWPSAVICEHIEDVRMMEADRFVLRQIKTRKPDYGGWRLTELCLSNGALCSILLAGRAIKEVEDHQNARYEIQLEGFLARGDLIRNLSRESPRRGRRWRRPSSRPSRTPTSSPSKRPAKSFPGWSRLPPTTAK